MSLNNNRLGKNVLNSLVTLGLAAVAVGCMPSAKPKAAQSLACGKDAIELEDADGSGHAKIVSGCGKKDVLTFDKDKWGSLRERAAFEMTCGAGELEVTVIESTLYGVTGCNHKIVYKWSPYVGLVVQTASDTAAPAPEAAPAAPAPTPVAPEPAPAATPEPPAAAAAPAAPAAPASKANAKPKSK